VDPEYLIVRMTPCKQISLYLIFTTVYRREPNPFSVGEGDRLPFGFGGSGGMLMDPFRQGGMPRLPQ